MVSLRAGKPGVYDPARLGSGSVQSLRGLADDAPPDRRDRERRPAGVGPPGLELRLDEHERLPARRGEPQRRRQRELRPR